MLIERENIWDKLELQFQEYKMNLFHTITQPYKRFSEQVSSQDLLRFVAILTMFIDHIGVFFYPNHEILRAIGRSSFIIWFFFCGYNFKKENYFDKQLFICAIFFSFSRFIINGKIFPLNILFTMILSRLALHYYNNYVNKKGELNNFEWILLCSACMLTFLITNLFIEYGSLGIIISLLGYNSKNKFNNLKFQTFTTLIITLTNWYWKFKGINVTLVIIIITTTFFSLWKFSPKFLNINGPQKYIINFCSRYSLYIYIIHLLLFLIISKAII